MHAIESAKARLLKITGYSLVWTFWLIPLNWFHANADEPAWKNGVSTWTGDGYAMPSTPTPIGANPAGANAESGTTPAFELPANSQAATPYSVPVEPVNPTSALPPLGLPPIDYTPKVAPASAGDEGGSVIGIPAEHESAAPSVDQVQFTQPVIGNAVRTNANAQTMPLQETTTRWYQYPWRWMTTGWDNHAEFGLDGSDGNADTLALQTGLEMKRKTDAYTLGIDIDYRFAESQGVRNENNGRFNLDYDRLFPNTPWSAFGKFGLEYDTFKVFDLRVNLNGGVGYHWIRDDNTTLVTRFGAGASQEIGAPDDSWVAEAVFGAEYERQVNKRNKIKAKVDYFPEWSDFDNFRLVTDLGWEILLDEADNLSLKLALTDRYDSTPQGAEANDVYYSMLLLFKF